MASRCLRRGRVDHVDRGLVGGQYLLGDQPRTHRGLEPARQRRAVLSGRPNESGWPGCPSRISISPAARAAGTFPSTASATTGPYTTVGDSARGGAAVVATPHPLCPRRGSVLQPPADHLHVPDRRPCHTCVVAAFQRLSAGPAIRPARSCLTGSVGSGSRASPRPGLAGLPTTRPIGQRSRSLPTMPRDQVRDSARRRPRIENSRSRPTPEWTPK
jgi:hypothetical protein